MYVIVLFNNWYQSSIVGAWYWVHVRKTVSVWGKQWVWVNQSEQYWLQFNNLVAKRRNDYVVVMLWSLLISIVTKSPHWWSMSFSSSISYVIFYKWLFSWKKISRRRLTWWLSCCLFLFLPVLPFSFGHFGSNGDLSARNLPHIKETKNTLQQLISTKVSENKI